MTPTRSFPPLPTRRATSSGRLALAVAGLCVVGLTAGCAQDSSLNVGRTGAAKVSAAASGAPTAPAAGSSAPGTPGGGAAAVPEAKPGPLGAAADLAILDRVQVVESDKGPSLKLATVPLQVSGTTRRVVRAGDGAVAQSGGGLLINAVVVKGSDGTQLETTFGGQPQPLQLSTTGTLKGLVTGLAGAQKGSRVLVALPPSESFEGQGNAQAGISPTEHLLFLVDIVDVLPTQAQGTAVPPVPGLPTVTAFDTAKGPTISIPAGVEPPATLVSQTLIEGAGAPVQAGQSVTVQYTGVLWKDGSVFDSSWSRGAFTVANIGQGRVIAGWNKGFIGKKVGSRVVLVVPPADGYGPQGSPPKISGTDTLVFVVDILSAT